ncbi:hypothetical protein Barb4_01631 [Bacteroidales bacterium Barb4]|nr:hypothetical protein Barb4_01629 [Bacteroidales bacterium Barb4]OAV69760.1 hypothetical protein Barb4_01631 [Bacteroidales bacterium Barb4]
MLNMHFGALAVVEIALLLIAVIVIIITVTGVILVAKEKQLSMPVKLLWFVLMVLFNVFTLVFFLVWRKNARTLVDGNS